eukprot:10509-Heterococcus_DN1.PRE.2
MADPGSAVLLPHVGKKGLDSLVDAMRDKLTELIEYEADSVLTDYVVLMLRNHKCASEVGVEMQEMVGAEAAEAFALWLARRP